MENSASSKALVSEYVAALKAERLAWDALKDVAKTPQYDDAFVRWSQASARTNLLAQVLRNTDREQI